MSSGKYKSYTRADALLQQPGYIKAFLNLKTDFTTLSEPDTNVNSGDQKIINDPHVWAAGKGPRSVDILNPII